MRMIVLFDLLKNIIDDFIHSREVFFTESPSAKFISGGDFI